MAIKTVDPQYFNYAVPTGPGTDPATPQVTELAFPLKIMREVQLTIPSGHVGVTGFALQVAEAIILPWESGSQWIVGDDDRFVFEINVEVNAGVNVLTYNLGFYDHTHYVRFRLDDLPAPAGTPASFVPLPLHAASSS